MRALDLPERFTRQQTIGGRGKDRVEFAQQLASPAFHLGGGQRSDGAGQPKGPIKPELEAHPDKVAAVFFNEAGLAIDMGKASLVAQDMALLSAITIRDPDVGLGSAQPARLG
jgi:hypothetical protein